MGLSEAAENIGFITRCEQLGFKQFKKRFSIRSTLIKSCALYLFELEKTFNKLDTESLKKLFTYSIEASIVR